MNGLVILFTIIALIVALVMGLTIYLRLASWKVYGRELKRAQLVMGDDAAPPTRWYNHWWLAFHGWKTVAIIEARGKYISPGYKPLNGGIAKFSTERVRDGNQFRVRIGREACYFFAVNMHGDEVGVELVKKTRIDDPDTQHIPLY